MGKFHCIKVLSSVFFLGSRFIQLFLIKNPRGFQLYTPENQDGTKKKTPRLKRKIVFQTSIVGFHVDFPGGKLEKCTRFLCSNNLAGGLPGPLIFPSGICVSRGFTLIFTQALRAIFHFLLACNCSLP